MNDLNNKETLQRNNTRISENNTDLSSILDTVNSLPKAGAGFEINDCSYLFYTGSRLDALDNILTLCKNVTNCFGMFQECHKLTNLDLSNFDTSNVTTMGNMFYNNTNLEELDVSGFDTSNVTSMSNMFGNCKLLEELDLSSFNTKNVINISQMFSLCENLVTLDLSNFDVSNVNNVSSVFYNNTSLTNLTFMNDLGKGYTQKTANYSRYKLDLSKSTNLTYESLIDVINKLYDLNLSYDVANGGTLYRQQLVLGSTNLAKLTEEEIAIATNKGWNVS